MTSSIVDVDEEDLKLTPHWRVWDLILGHDHSRSSFLDGNCNKDVTRRAIDPFGLMILSCLDRQDRPCLLLSDQWDLHSLGHQDYGQKRFDASECGSNKIYGASTPLQLT